MSLPLPEVLQQEIVYKQFLRIRKDTLQLSDGSHYDYYSLTTTPFAVMVLATTEEGLFVINEEYRHPTGQILLSCPGGLLEKGESVLEGARRELLEETGYAAQEFCEMGHSFPLPGISTQKIFFVHAQGAFPQESPQLEQAEIMQTRVFSPEKLRQKIAAGNPIDGVLCTALFWWGMHHPQHAAT